MEEYSYGKSKKQRMKLTDLQLALLPSDEDIELYQKTGYYHSKTLFTEAEMQTVLEASERYYRGEIDGPSSTAEHLQKYKPTGEIREGLRKNDFSSMYNLELRRLVTHPLIGAIAAKLARSPEIRLWHDQLLYKPPQDPNRPANVGWHTDRGYWKTCSSPGMLTAWIPFHDCPVEMGTITMIEGSHLWPDNTENLNFFSNDLEGLEAGFMTGGNPVVKVPMNLLRGQVSFHNCLTIHGSGPNFSSDPRRSIAVHLQDKTNHWVEYHHSNGSLAAHDNDRLCRKIAGKPDYADPDFCPILYEEGVGS